jgi:hypothetical protein
MVVMAEGCGDCSYYCGSRSDSVDGGTVVSMVEV